jgi:hypothetical protein
MTQGERAIQREEKRMAREKRRRIDEANKMLIPTGDKTTKSLGLISFDPDGAFRLEENMWLKVYSVDSVSSKLVSIAKKISGALRLNLSMRGGGRETCHLSIYEEGEVYEDVRERFKKDEEEIGKVISIHPMTVNEVMQGIAFLNYRDVGFSYASMVRGKKDWKKECFHELSCTETDFQLGQMVGESMQALDFSDEVEPLFIEDIIGLGCDFDMTVQLDELRDEDAGYFRRYMEKQYNRRLLTKKSDDINLSISFTFFCDSLDAKAILESTIATIFLKKGVLLVPAFNEQQIITESNLSLGLIRHDLYRNVSLCNAVNILGGEKDDDSEVEVRSDESK